MVGEFGGAALDGVAVFLAVGQCGDSLGDAVFVAGDVHRLADNHVAFLDFAGEQTVEIRQLGAGAEAEQEGERGEN